MHAPHPAVVDGVITVAAVVLRDARGRVLTVRKRGTTTFMLPGGKLEPGETPDRAAAREAREEVGLVVSPGSLLLLGEFTTATANEPDHVLRSTVFVVPGPYDDAAAASRRSPALAAAGEIAELRWLDPSAPLPGDVAPLLRDAVLPALHGGAA